MRHRNRMGNGNLGSLYDRSYGFFRRQIVLTVKERKPDREDDPFLGEKLIAGAESNLEKALGERSFSNFLRQNEDKYRLTYTNNIALGNGKTARGFKGIHVKVRTEERH